MGDNKDAHKKPKRPTASLFVLFVPFCGLKSGFDPFRAVKFGEEKIDFSVLTTYEDQLVLVLSAESKLSISAFRQARILCRRT